MSDTGDHCAWKLSRSCRLLLRWRGLVPTDFDTRGPRVESYGERQKTFFTQPGSCTNCWHYTLLSSTHDYIQLTPSRQRAIKQNLKSQNKTWHLQMNKHSTKKSKTTFFWDTTPRHWLIASWRFDGTQHVLSSESEHPMRENLRCRWPKCCHGG
jgi:hypothetical protein